MPPKRKAQRRKVRGPKEAFEEYTIQQGRNVTQPGAVARFRRDANRIWPNVHDDQKDEFYAAYQEKLEAEELVKDHKRLVKQAKTAKIAKIAVARAGNNRDVRNAAMRNRIRDFEGSNNDEENQEEDDVQDDFVEGEEWREVVEAWAALRERQKGLVAAQANLTVKSERFRSAVNAIYPAQANYSLQQHHYNRQAEVQAKATLWRMTDDEDRQGIPQTSTGQVKVPSEWLPKVKRDLRNKYLKIKFSRETDALDEDEGWDGAWSFAAQGGHGTTKLWHKFDGHGNIRDRVVSKDVYRSERSWADMTEWDYPFEGPRNEDTMLPVEAACHYNLNAIASRRIGQRVDVPYLHGHTVDVENLKYTIYLEFCTYKDLEYVIEQYRDRSYDAPGSRHIPEPFLWRTFLSLAVAGLAMERGTVDRDEVDDGWTREIVHRDIKPGNIFLDQPTKHHFESYPTPKLGDFDTAMKTNKDDALNPKLFYTWIGTLGWEAPEQQSYSDLRNCKPVHDFKMLAYTNVYSMGMVMLSLMTLDLDPEEIRWLGHGTEHERWINQPPYWQRTRLYSATLRDLVQSCLFFDPSSRSTFEELVQDIEVAIETYNMANGRRTRRNDPQNAHVDDLMYDQHHYADALHRGQLRPLGSNPDLRWYKQ